MADGEQAAEDRTEAPTERRIEQAREQGQLPISRDVTALASLTGAALGAAVLAPEAGQRLLHQSAGLLGVLDRIGQGSSTGGTLSSFLGGPVLEVLVSAALLVAAVAVPAALCSIGSVLLQTDFYVGGAPIRIQLSRINPGAGLARLVSWHNLLDFLKSCARLAVLCWLAWSVLGNSPTDALAILGADVVRLMPAVQEQVEGFVRPLLVVLACFAVVDMLLVRLQHAKSIRMTREQVRLEMRDQDGDPFIKAKLRRIREQRSRRRMMAKVKSAAVVVTNPTHYAVALSYERRGTTAPRVVAKGADLVAARIREEAQAHGVPIVPNPPLARALYGVELDREIPAEHYRAVAEVIAFVWRLKNRLAASSEPLPQPHPGMRP